MAGRHGCRNGGSWSHCTNSICSLTHHGMVAKKPWLSLPFSVKPFWKDPWSYILMYVFISKSSQANNED